MLFEPLLADKDSVKEVSPLRRRSSFAFDEPEGAKEILLGETNESGRKQSYDESPRLEHR